MPDREPARSVATPLEPVVAAPTRCPLRVKLMDFPPTPVAPEVRVATRLPVLPPYVPAPGETDKDVADVKVARTDCAALLMLKLHVLPRQPLIPPPLFVDCRLHPEKTEPALAVAVSVPVSKLPTAGVHGFGEPVQLAL